MEVEVGSENWSIEPCCAYVSYFDEERIATKFL